MATIATISNLTTTDVVFTQDELTGKNGAAPNDGATLTFHLMDQEVIVEPDGGADAARQFTNSTGAKYKNPKYIVRFHLKYACVEYTNGGGFLPCTSHSNWGNGYGDGTRSYTEGLPDKLVKALGFKPTEQYVDDGNIPVTDANNISQDIYRRLTTTGQNKTAPCPNFERWAEGILTNAGIADMPTNNETYSYNVPRIGKIFMACNYFIQFYTKDNVIYFFPDENQNTVVFGYAEAIPNPNYTA